MKNNLFIITIILLTLQTSAQIKIGNNDAVSPNVALEVTGSITVRDKIYAGGDDNTLGNPGKPDQVLVSDGPGKPPRWRTLNIPTIQENFYYLIYNNSFTDFTNDGITNNEGTLINNTTGNNGPYELGVARNNTMFANFATIGATANNTTGGLTQTFDVFSNENQVYITFEAVAHLDATADTDEGVDFVCGIFVGGGTQATRTLRGIRKLTLQRSYGAAGNPFITYTQIALASGLTVPVNNPKATYYVEVACKRTATYGSVTNVGLGRAVETNINNFVAKTSLKVEVYEMPEEDRTHDIYD